MSFGRILTATDVELNRIVKQQVANMIDVVKTEMEEYKASMTKEFNVEVKGWTYDNLFIKVTDSDGFMTGRDNWRGFEELAKELREDAIAKGYRDIKINMTFR